MNVERQLDAQLPGEHPAYWSTEVPSLREQSGLNPSRETVGGSLPDNL